MGSLIGLRTSMSLRREKSTTETEEILVDGQSPVRRIARSKEFDSPRSDLNLFELESR